MFPVYLVSKVIYRILKIKLASVGFRMHNVAFADINQELKQEMCTFVRKIICSDLNAESHNRARVEKTLPDTQPHTARTRKCSLEGSCAKKKSLGKINTYQCNSSYIPYAQSTNLPSNLPSNPPTSQQCTYDDTTININWIQLGKKAKTIVTTYNIPLTY
jgi:hypothetical protein